MSLFEEVSPPTENINGVTVHRFPFNRWHYPLLDFSNKVSGKLRNKPLPYYIMKKRWGLDCKGINNMMQQSDTDIIMGSTANYMFCDYPAWRLKTKKPKPFALYGSIHFHFTYPDDHPYLRRARMCDCYIANTAFEKETLVNYGVASEKIVVTGTGISADELITEQSKVYSFREAHRIEQDEILIGHIGRLSEGKGVGILLDAFRQIYAHNKKVKLLLAGTTTLYVESIKKEITEGDLPVILLTDFNESQKSILFNAIDIFVLASKGESFGVVFLEAWACGKPVIGADTGAVSSVIFDGKDGFLYKGNNAESLAKKINQLIADPGLRHDFGTNGLFKVQEKYSWKYITAAYRNAYLVAIENFKRRQNLIRANT